MASIPRVEDVWNIPVLWQPLDQCPMIAQAINLKGRYLVENMSCVIHKRT